MVFGFIPECRSASESAFGFAGVLTVQPKELSWSHERPGSSSCTRQLCGHRWQKPLPLFKTVVRFMYEGKHSTEGSILKMRSYRVAIVSASMDFEHWPFFALMRAARSRGLQHFPHALRMISDPGFHSGAAGMHRTGPPAIFNPTCHGGPRSVYTSPTTTSAAFTARSRHARNGSGDHGSCVGFGGVVGIE